VRVGADLRVFAYPYLDHPMSMLTLNMLDWHIFNISPIFEGKK